MVEYSLHMGLAQCAGITVEGTEVFWAEFDALGLAFLHEFKPVDVDVAQSLMPKCEGLLGQESYVDLPVLFEDIKSIYQLGFQKELVVFSGSDLVAMLGGNVEGGIQFALADQIDRKRRYQESVVEVGLEEISTNFSKEGGSANSNCSGSCACSEDTGIPKKNRGGNTRRKKIIIYFNNIYNKITSTPQQTK